MKKPKINRSLLRKVLKHIKEEPRRFNMGTWASLSQNAPCGTQACIGGWTCILAKGNTEKTRKSLILDNEKWGSPGSPCVDIEKRARKFLGLTEEESKCLFLTGTRYRGELGVVNAEKKIKLLLSDRDAFTKKYYSLYERY